MRKPREEKQLMFDFGDSVSETPPVPEKTDSPDLLPGESVSSASPVEIPPEEPESFPETAVEFPETAEAQDFSAEKPVPVVEIVPEKIRKQPLNEANLRRAALAFLASLEPEGLAVNVPVNFKNIRADAAAFWTRPGGKRGVRKICRTALALVRTSREINTECSNHEEIRKLLSAVKMERDLLEDAIRRSEPELKEADNLFTDFETWDYSGSSSPAYQECLKKIEDLEGSLYRGTLSDRIRSAGMASELYMVVPEGAVSPDEVADAWGLVFVNENLEFHLVKTPLIRQCPAENQQRFVGCIAAAALKNVLFANGIQSRKNGFRLGRVPRKRHV